jgi:hypothetical protein
MVPRNPSDAITSTSSLTTCCWGYCVRGIASLRNCYANMVLPWSRYETRCSKTEARVAPHVAAAFARLDQWLAEVDACEGTWTVTQGRVANGTTHFAIYAVDPPKENESGEEAGSVEKLQQIQRRLDFIVERMENAIANHEFEKARFYSDEERKERQNLRAVREQFNLEEPAPRVALLCIEIIRDESFSEVQKRCEEYVAEGVRQVWLLEPNLKRAFTITKTEGLREFKGGILQIATPPLEMDLRRIFDWVRAGNGISSPPVFRSTKRGALNRYSEYSRKTLVGHSENFTTAMSLRIAILAGNLQASNNPLVAPVRRPPESNGCPLPRSKRR